MDQAGRLRAALIAGGAGAAAAASVAAYALAIAPAGGRSFVVLTSTVGLLLLLASAILAEPRALPWGVLLLAAAYLEALIPGPGFLDAAAPLVGTALLLCAELVYWSLDLRTEAAAEAAVHVERALAIGLTAAGGLALGAVALAASTVGGGLAAVAIAAVAIVAGGLAASRLAWRTRG